ncbi:MAG TPA: acVLRF1 family peptidyl-tRNA hydrolase [Nocardioidaceae bacterium]|nr:acVLRF1 family peptidyl-tRNA hydrolase [Nocardioidaceae bacterium]
MRTVLVPLARVERWLENFGSRHGQFTLTADPLTATAEDGAVAVITGPFGTPAVLPPRPPDVSWGLLLVRRGGFAVAAGSTTTPTRTKVGKRHVQGKTKAGGWSQQRFARRRDNQARDAFEAAADHAHRILVQEHPVDVLVCGGDRGAVDAVLADPRLRGLVDKVTGPWLAVPDPNAAILTKAVEDAWSCSIQIAEPADEVLP